MLGALALAGLMGAGSLAAARGTFRTREGHGLDTSLYDASELSYKPTSAKPELIHFPLIICLEAAGGALAVTRAGGRV